MGIVFNIPKAKAIFYPLKVDYIDLGFFLNPEGVGLGFSTMSFAPTRPEKNTRMSRSMVPPAICV